MHVSQFLSKEDLDNHISHIIRDIFPQTDAPTYFGEDIELFKTFRTSLHNIPVNLLYKYPSNTWDPDKHMALPEHLVDACFPWAIEFNDCFLADGFCDLFISINYHLELDTNAYEVIAKRLKFLTKKNALYFIVNPGTWATALNSFLVHRDDIVKELKAYCLLRDQEVYVYENI